MKRIYKILERISSALFVMQKVILLVMVVAIVSIVVTDVFLRILISGGLAWAQETCIALFMSLIFLGGNIAIKSDGEIKVEVLRIKNETVQLLLLTAVDVICLFVIFRMFASAVSSVDNAIANPQYLATVPLGYSVLYLVMPIGFALMFLDKMVALLRRFYNAELFRKLREEAQKMENSDQ